MLSDHDSIFRNSDVFESVNSEAQKRACGPTEAPALTWHMAFLVPRAERTGFAKNIDAVARRIVEGLHREKLIASEDRVEPHHCKRMMFFDGFYSFDKSTSRLVDVSSAASAREQNYLRTDERRLVIKFALDGARHFTSADFTIVIKRFVNIFTISVQAEKPSVFAAPLDARAYHAATITFWNDFSRFIVGLDGDIVALLKGAIFKHVFADMRGLIVTKTLVPFDDYPVQADDAPKWATPALLARLAPLVTYGGEHECTVSYLLGGRALFLTSLAPQALDFPDDKRLPLSFVLLVQDGNKAFEHNVPPGQLGRLLDRMHLIGMLRHAALLDLPQLWDASKGLAEMDPSVSEARGAVEAFDRTSQANEAAAAASKTRSAAEVSARASQASKAATTASDAVASARELFNQIGHDFLMDERNSARVGISLRIENSRYYVSQFKAHVRALRLRRVEGYRRYDEFVQRRLGATFEFIHRLGIRYERATNGMAALDQTLATARARKTSEDMGRSIDQVRNIQEYGELFLLLFLIPYYVLGVIHFIQDQETGAVRLAIVSILLLTTQLVILRFLKKTEGIEKKVAAGLLLQAVVGMCWAAAAAIYFLEIDVRKYANDVYGIVAIALGVVILGGALVRFAKRLSWSSHVIFRSFVAAGFLASVGVILYIHREL